MHKICRFFEVDFAYFLEEKSHSDLQLQQSKEVISGIDKGNNFQDSIIGQINALMLDNNFKENQIKELLAQIAELENKIRTNKFCS